MPDALTATQQAVLHRIAYGDTIAQAARALGIPKATTEAALYQARRQLGARTTTHAVVLAAERRLLTAPPRTRARPLDPEVRDRVRQQYPSVDMGEQEWAAALDARPDVYDRLLAAIGRAPARPPAPPHP